MATSSVRRRAYSSVGILNEAIGPVIGLYSICHATLQLSIFPLNILEEGGKMV